ncbi:MAG: type IV pili methyl-accepting chemotaxis transducer N-terminal domain-containing protein [Alteromonadaceae bacterium]|nr:type IV pili methyl-accepting chemotaxis transducer N-terminal domain-containing protein [Alteromonadaceae bacterium]
MLGVVSMISSMLVTESLSGDAAKINSAGALRMQAIRISRAYFVEHTDNNQLIKKESQAFDKRLKNLLAGGLLNSGSNPKISKQYQKIVTFWTDIKHKKNHQHSALERQKSFADFDHFVEIIDKLVTLLQLESENKLSILRLIQGLSLLLVLIISVIVLIKLNKSVIIPLKQLVNVANEAGKGNFDLKVQYQGDDELGVLSHTINQMSNELKTTYQDFEQRVEQKTQELTQSNQSLEMLFHAAKQLTSYDSHQTSNPQSKQNISPLIIKELEQVLGFGKVNIKLNQQNNLIIDVTNPLDNIDHICFNHIKFPLEKQTLLFGYLIWQFPKTEQVKPWQQQILQAMADIIATAIELDQKRNSENRLLIMEERAVIARELHDSLAQSLSYLKVQMSLLTRKMQKQVPSTQLDEGVNETIKDIKQGLNAAYLQLRELLTTFRLKLDDPSLENSLQGTVAEFKEKCQHPIKLNYQLPNNYLNANQEIHLLQIIREALSNIYRHAKASKASVDISQINDIVNIKISDNGKGLPKEFTQQGHFGLGIMEERAKSLNTLINIKTIKPHGTEINLTFKR